MMSCQQPSMAQAYFKITLAVCRCVKLFFDRTMDQQLFVCSNLFRCMCNNSSGRALHWKTNINSPRMLGKVQFNKWTLVSNWLNNTVVLVFQFLNSSKWLYTSFYYSQTHSILKIMSQTIMPYFSNRYLFVLLMLSMVAHVLMIAYYGCIAFLDALRPLLLLSLVLMKPLHSKYVLNTFTHKQKSKLLSSHFSQKR